jgi:hypothetical protein
MVKWRGLDIDWFSPFEHEARLIVQEFFGPIIPLRLWHLLERREYQRIIRGFTLTR